MRTALARWSVASPQIHAMINATQVFATEMFTAPKVTPSLLPMLDVEKQRSQRSPARWPQLCEVLAQTVIGLKDLVKWTARLEPGGRASRVQHVRVRCACLMPSTAAGYVETSRTSCCEHSRGLPEDLIAAVRGSQVRRIGAAASHAAHYL